MDINEIPIFVSSADSYIDIWPAFFALFKREWPTYRGTIYLNTETLDYSFRGLNIVCTRLGKQKRFGQSFRRGVDFVPGDEILLLMIDYFIEAPVNVAALQGMYNIFHERDVDTFTLMTQPYGFKPIATNPGVAYLEPKESWRIMFSFQTAFWKKTSLKRLIASWEDPWRAEYFGSRRAAAYGMKFYVLSDKSRMPIRYDEAGVLHGGGKWLDSAISRVNLDGIPLDLSKSARGHFCEPSNPVIQFIVGEIKVFPSKMLSWLSIILERPMAIRFMICDFARRASRLFSAVLKRANRK